MTLWRCFCGLLFGTGFVGWGVVVEGGCAALVVDQPRSRDSKGASRGSPHQRGSRRSVTKRST